MSFRSLLISEWPLLLGFLFVLITTATKTKSTTNALGTAGHTTRHTAADGLSAVNDTRRGVAHGLLSGNVASIITLPSPLGSSGALLGGEVADGLRETALAELSGREVVDAVLQLVDLVDASDFRLVEVF